MSGSIGPLSTSIVGTVSPGMFSGLTWDQIRELHDIVTRAEPNPEAVAAAVDSTVPSLAAVFRNGSTASLETAAQFATILGTVVSILALMLSIYAILQHEQSVSPGQVTQIIEQTTVNLPPHR